MRRRIGAWRLTEWGAMRIETITLRKLRMRLRSPFEASFGTIWERVLLLVEVSADGLSGWGEVTAPEGSFYNPETVGTSWHITCDFLVPLLLGKRICSAC